MNPRLSATLFVALALSSAGCGGVSSEEQARRAYLGLDKSIGKSLALGFAGFNAATSANISAQSTTGDKSGTLTITGQVDQGASANKGMRLKVGMVDYSDGTQAVDGGSIGNITYKTATDPAAQPALELSLKNIPTGTLTGTLVGDFEMAGDMTGPVHLNLTMSGNLEDDGTGKVRRKAGTTTVSGTATAGQGTYQVNLTL